jgi:hypothetical protein
MEYKDFEYHVDADGPRWRWTVSIGATAVRTGRSLTRAVAVLRAEQSIDQLQRISDERSFGQETRHSG